jgi:cytoplasmic iron level regulating protein YaaA (DUF328/UPF0246 family)
MKIIISPAKSITIQEFEGPLSPTCNVFLDDSERLVNKLKQLSAGKIANMMSVNSDIAELNYERYQGWERPTSETELVKPAIQQFTGEVYRGLDAKSMSEEVLERTQENLRILSGLYGILKPMDLMYPYRLEMGIRWAVTPKVKNLYLFWGRKLAVDLNESMHKDEVLINLASSEYFKAIDLKTLKAKMITPIFKEFKNGEFKVLMTYAKNARGRMARYILDNGITNPDELKMFDWDRYSFNVNLSTETEFVFTR